MVRKAFNKLPEDIQLLIANMVSTVPENRESESLQRAIELFEKHMQSKHHKTFTRKTQSSISEDTAKKNDGQALGKKRYISPITARLGFLFGLLLLIFVQYLYLFDGQEKINQSVPGVYDMLVDHIAGSRTD